MVYADMKSEKKKKDVMSMRRAKLNNKVTYICYRMLLLI
jgi:hypothetical protein